MSKRSEFKTFINVGTTLVPNWALLGEGVTSGAINYNASTTEEVFIHQDSGVTNIESYKPTMPVEAKHDENDEAIAYLDQLRKSRPTLDAAYGEIVNVWLYIPAVGGEYPAEKQAVTYQFESFGGEGGVKNVLNFTINYRGDPVKGSFDPVAMAFTTDPNFLYA